jgi:25S rRNA (uracil2634-N3)-methyltransferase
MGKKRKLAQSARSHNKPSNRINASGSGKKSATPAGKSQNQSHHTNNGVPSQQQQHTEPTIPFSPEDKILLVGDGDLSFAASLVEHHYCADVTATVFEKNRDELLEKYPHAAENVEKIEAEDGCRVIFAVDATKMAPFTNKPGRGNKNSSNSEHTGSGQHPASASPQGVMDRVIFNFPHVGGKSTDVNRQVRYNQELLVSFFQRAIPSLAPGGSIVVTLFEGEPYTLWNIRDLARHSGLQVERSFRFQASAYPGYHHARTLGVVRNHSGETGGGWKGEDRASRSYVFVKKDADARPSAPPRRGVKRSRKHDDDSSDED